MRKSAPIILRDACIQEASRPYIFLVHGAAKRVPLAITSARHRTTGGDPKALLSARERPIDSQSRICEPEKHIMQIAAFCRKSAALIALLGVAGGALAADTWRVATEGTFPPFEFYDSNTGELQGFEVDLVKEMAKVMGKDLKLESMSFDAIIPALISGTVDAGAAGFSITPERAKRLKFTVPFYRSGLTIVVPKANKAGIQDFDDLKGKRISVQIGSTSMAYAKKIEGAKVTTFASAGDAILNMLAGNADAVINDKPVTDYIRSRNSSIAENTIHLEPIATADQFAMVTTKANAKLSDEMSAALKTLKANGKFEELHQKWFGRSADPDLP